MGAALLAKGNSAQAELAYENALQLDPSSSEFRKGRDAARRASRKKDGADKEREPADAAQQRANEVLSSEIDPMARRS